VVASWPGFNTGSVFGTELVPSFLHERLHEIIIKKRRKFFNRI
jgi:hypothetical protein